MAKKSTQRKSPPASPSPLVAVLQDLVVPAFEAEEQPDADGPCFEMSDPESGDDLSISGLLRGEALVTVVPMEIDSERTLLRFSLLTGYIIADCSSALFLLGNLLEPTPFQLRINFPLGSLGCISIGCDVTVRADDAPLVRRRLAELLQLAEDLKWFYPLRMPHHLSWRDVHELEIEWAELPHYDLAEFLDGGLAAPRDERTPLTLLRVAQGLGRWKDVLTLLSEHPETFPRREWGFMKCFAYRNLKRWSPAIRAAKEGGIQKGCYPGAPSVSPAYAHSLIEAGDEIEALRLLGKPKEGEPDYYDWLRGMALHRAGDREQAATAFHCYFEKWPCDIIATTEVNKMEAEE